MNHNMNMDHGGHGQHDHADGGHGMEMSMPMVFTASTQVTLLFSWWSTTTAFSYVFTLLFLFLLVLLNKFLGILKLQLDQQPTNTDHKTHEALKLDLPSSRWARNRASKVRVSPLLPRVEANEDSDHYGAVSSSPLLHPTPQLSSQPHGEEPHVNSQPRLFRSYRKWIWQQGSLSSLLEGLRALIGYALRVLMTYNIGVLCAVLAGVVVSELFLGRFSPTSSGWQDGACHDG
ncbi:hypothetical protein MYU51_012417 [Penicillium brevicompactum]